MLRARFLLGRPWRKGEGIGFAVYHAVEKLLAGHGGEEELICGGVASAFNGWSASTGHPWICRAAAFPSPWSAVEARRVEVVLSTMLDLKVVVSSGFWCSVAGTKQFVKVQMLEDMDLFVSTATS